MKDSSSSDPPRFTGGIRHYHRAAPPQNASWDEWIDGRPKSGRRAWNWPKIIGIIASLLVLGAIIAGLIIDFGMG